MDAGSAQPVENHVCRICHEVQHCEESNPILDLGCSCKGDLAWAHRSCIVEWFGGHNFKQVNLAVCEVCRGHLGHVVKGISFFTGLMTIWRSAIPGKLILNSNNIEQVKGQWESRCHILMDLSMFKLFTQEERDCVEVHVQRILTEQYIAAGM